MAREDFIELKFSWQMVAVQYLYFLVFDSLLQNLDICLKLLFLFFNICYCVLVVVSDKENGPNTLNDVKLINAGKILENNRTLAESRLPVSELPGGVITMHVVLRPPMPDKNSDEVDFNFIFSFDRTIAASEILTNVIVFWESVSSQIGLIKRAEGCGGLDLDDAVSATGESLVKEYYMAYDIFELYITCLLTELSFSDQDSLYHNKP
ncbi:hypothetical protein GH714_001979 [Hevea brasiliensis]|uniref:UBL3-like ubiquitin domain-containing protein n=1 Tax=Hevea brasiliensis TaxID=3981 RepID=A0A6A6L5V9_HEVBR|nr:hypothetical protein GH714_001979 [Hevea brasiliensis]